MQIPNGTQCVFFYFLFLFLFFVFLFSCSKLWQCLRRICIINAMTVTTRNTRETVTTCNDNTRYTVTGAPAQQRRYATALSYAHIFIAWHLSGWWWCNANVCMCARTIGLVSPPPFAACVLVLLFLACYRCCTAHWSCVLGRVVHSGCDIFVVVAVVINNECRRQ